MTLDAAVKVYIDWDNDGFGVGDEIQGYVIQGSVTLGITEPGELVRVASVGQLKLTLDNASRLFSFGNLSGALFGKLLPGKAVKVTATVAAVTYTLFTGTVTEFAPDSNLYGPRTCAVLAEDRMADFQAETTLTLPLQTDQRADDLLRLIGSAVYCTDPATGTLTFVDALNNGDTVTIGAKNYRFTGGAVVNAYDVSTGMYEGEASVNLYKAIVDNAPGGTEYGPGTLAHPEVVAEVRPTVGQRSASGGFAIGYLTQMVSEELTWPEEVDSRPMQKVYLHLKKTGSPTDATIKVVQGGPGGALRDANATLTLTAGDVTTTAAWVEFTFPAAFTIYRGDWLTIEMGAEDASNYFTISNASSNYPGYSATKSYSTGAWTQHSTDCALWIDGVITLTAKARGSYGNTIALASNTANIVASDTTLTGGTDGPSGALDYDSGVQLFDYAADLWREQDLNAITAIEQVILSEYGFFLINREGQPVFRNTHFLFEAANTTGVILANTQAELAAPRVSRDDIVNIVNVVHTPRSPIVNGEIARSDGAFRVDPNTTLRWSATDPTVPSTLKLAFRDSAGNDIAATEVDALVEGTHFDVNDRADGTGFDYTGHGQIRVSWVVTATGIEITFANAADGALYIRNLTVTGKGLIPFSPEVIVREDAVSISAYGRHPADYALDLPVAGSFPGDLATWLLNSQKTARLVFDSALYDAPSEAGSAHLFSLDLFDLVEIADDQIGLSANNPNLINNGDFADGETNWTAFGGIVHSVSGGKLHLYRNGGADFPGMTQAIALPVSAGDMFSATFKVANTSAGDKAIGVHLHGPSYEWYSVQNFLIAAGASESIKVVAGAATAASSELRFTIYVLTDDNLADLTFDDIRVAKATAKCVVTGVDYQLTAGDVSQVALYVRPTPVNTYWQLGNSTFGKLGSTTRLAL